MISSLTYDKIPKRLKSLPKKKSKSQSCKEYREKRKNKLFSNKKKELQLQVINQNLESKANKLVELKRLLKKKENKEKLLWSSSYLVQKNEQLRQQNLKLRLIVQHNYFKPQTKIFSWLDEKVKLVKRPKDINKLLFHLGESNKTPIRINTLRVGTDGTDFVHLNYIYTGISFKKFLNITWRIMTKNSATRTWSKNLKCTQPELVHLDLCLNNTLVEYFYKISPLPIKYVSVTKIRDVLTGSYRYTCYVLNQTDKFATLSICPLIFDIEQKKFSILRQVLCSSFQDISERKLRVQAKFSASTVDAIRTVKNSMAFVKYLHAHQCDFEELN
eukprot:snap_masked-scaffold_4-processed-gene-19.27-mRNA-1 protein AED:1.00 eAED:1.00 QI:0/0/0/0/1/1/2/0/329